MQKKTPKQNIICRSIKRWNGALVQNILWQISKNVDNRTSNHFQHTAIGWTQQTNWWRWWQFSERDSDKIYANSFFLQCLRIFANIKSCQSISSLVNMHNIQLFSCTNWNNKWTNTMKTYFKCCALCSQFIRIVFS